MIECTFENSEIGRLRHVTVGCLVIKNECLLLAKRSRGLIEAGKWCLLGGFVDRDETTAQAGVRESLEESGWQIANLRLFRINDNPDRPHEDRQNIDLIYLADAIEKVGEKDWESEEVRWFPLDALPQEHKIAFDHADNIELYKRYLREGFAVPFIGMP